VPKAIKTLIFGLMILLGGAALYLFAFCPLFTQAQFTADQIKMKEAELQSIKAKVANMADLELTLQKMQAFDEVATPVIPAKLTLEELYSSIDSLTRASGLKVKQISTNQTFQPFAKDHRIKYIAVNLEGDAFFPQVIQFLDLISKSQFLIQIENMDLSSISKGSKPRLHFTLTLHAFEYVSN
jgi:Tfp pilus assembly protein PilO